MLGKLDCHLTLCNNLPRHLNTVLLSFQATETADFYKQHVVDPVTSSCPCGDFGNVPE